MKDRLQGQNSIEVLQETAERRLGREYRGLYYDRFTLVDPRSTRFVIDDISYRTSGSIQGPLEFLMLACKGEVQVYDAARLTAVLANKVVRLLEAVKTTKTVVIFPGNGAQVVKDLLPEDALQGTTAVSIPTERKVDSRTGAVQGVTISDVARVRKIFADVKPKTVLVLDDAIATGATIRALQEALGSRRTEWIAAALMVLSPTQRKRNTNGFQSGVEGYNTIIAPVVYQGITGQPALNSLSTLTDDCPKSVEVRTRYVQSFVTDPDVFNEAVDDIRKRLNPNEKVPQ